jgi:Delta7-sterol 5-desaturase
MLTSDVQSESAASSQAIWNFHPQLPVDSNPLFSWPIDLGACFKWYTERWLAFSDSTVYVLLAVLSWHYLTPPISAYSQWSVDWILMLYLRNFATLFVVAGSIHVYFYTLNAQKNEFKYYFKGLEKDHPRFTFNNQVWDNMFWSLASGVTVWTAYDAFIMWMYSSGQLAMIDWQTQPIWFLLAFSVIVAWEAIHFYVVHRLLHWRPLFRIAHSLHHRNINTGPWSGLSMHPLEHLIYFSSILIHLVLPTHPIHVIFHFYWLTLAAATTHTGFEGVKVLGKSRFGLGSFVHQLHHRYFECNYGNRDVPCDVWADSDHNGSEVATERTRLRRKKMNPGAGKNS